MSMREQYGERANRNGRDWGKTKPEMERVGWKAHSIRHLLTTYPIIFSLIQKQRVEMEVTGLGIFGGPGQYRSRAVGR